MSKAGTIVQVEKSPNKDVWFPSGGRRSEYYLSSFKTSHHFPLHIFISVFETPGFILLEAFEINH